MKMNMILRILEDQYPHSVSAMEIASLVNVPVEKVELFLRFLAKYGFITHDEKRKTAVMCADFFLLEENEED
ncbi:MAG: hypothetical protein H8D26_04145 [Methanomicrobia archaeon]|nr:hypothetical protein [Methanomicrobia archaeon]